MSDLKRIRGIFMGTQLMASEPNYKKWKANFLVGDKEWKFNYFTPWTKKDGSEKKGLKPEDLKIETPYNISYSEYQTEDMQYPSKTAVCFFKDDGQTTLKAGSRPQIVVNISKESMDKLSDAYFKLQKPEKQNVNHYIGTLVRTLNQKEVQPLIDEFEKRRKDGDKGEGS
jgi:hypothetical protein